MAATSPLVDSPPSVARILVVDDEENIRTLLSRILAPVGYAVDAAFHADAALILMKMCPADVVIVDMLMPGHDGAWLIDRIQADHPQTSFIIASGLHDLDPRLCLKPGVIGCLTKPFTAAIVKDMVRKALDARRAASAPRRQLRLLNPDSLDARDERESDRLT
jgi:DNA-binding NtrC family response regulator